jgi:hypothetical protein
MCTCVGAWCNMCIWLGVVCNVWVCPSEGSRRRQEHEVVSISLKVRLGGGILITYAGGFACLTPIGNLPNHPTRTGLLPPARTERVARRVHQIHHLHVVADRPLGAPTVARDGWRERKLDGQSLRLDQLRTPVGPPTIRTSHQTSDCNKSIGTLS